MPADTATARAKSIRAAQPSLSSGQALRLAIRSIKVELSRTTRLRVLDESIDCNSRYLLHSDPTGEEAVGFRVKSPTLATTSVRQNLNSRRDPADD